MPDGFAWYAMLNAQPNMPVPEASSPVFLSDTFNYLEAGDIMLIAEFASQS
jgi:hypothetical protein